MLDFINIGIIDIIDIVAVALGMYYIYKMTRGSVAMNIIMGVVFIYIVWVATRALNMELVSGILGGVINVGVIALFILFQPELRQFLQNVGMSQKRNALLRRLLPSGKTVSFDNTQLLNAVVNMSESKTGALIVLTQESDLSLIIDTGIVVDAQLSTPLIENLFFKNSPLHDGAVIVNGDRIVAARCVLPSTQQKVPKSTGMRHRAALGISDISDVIVIVVSEETGAISIAHDGQLKRGIAPDQLRNEIARYYRLIRKQQQTKQAKK
ncbi:MAG: diadenylate cyclase CdaA [Rikenellaceae bacterium]|nr:diadenylate cyclase CdaA [Rikenellaceae bacterium]